MSDPELSHQAWVEKAENDLLNIDNNVSASRVPWDTVCFHAQQAGEKYLKALLVRHRIPFPRTHELGALLTLCLDVAPSLESLKDDCARLTRHAVGARYSHLPGSFDEAEGQAAVAAARRIRTAIRPLLGGES